jgi:hypothetical protein
LRGLPTQISRADCHSGAAFLRRLCWTRRTAIWAGRVYHPLYAPDKARICFLRDYELLEMVERLFMLSTPLEEMFGGGGRSLRDQIGQHMDRNPGDWSVPADWQSMVR